MTVAAAILAAGRGSRAGSATAKPLLELQGRPLVSWALDAALASGLAPVVLVVGRRRRAVARAAPPGVTVVHARAWRRGIAHSLRAALASLDQRREVEAVCIGLADQPGVGPDAYRRLAAAREGGAAIAVATYDGSRGNPVLLAREVWSGARELHGDVGARALMVGSAVVEVDCTGTGDPRDVDTLDDLHVLEKELTDP